jgi:SMC interacting uncharacterized protein involved in chromosome segregation
LRTSSDSQRKNSGSKPDLLENLSTELREANERTREYRDRCVSNEKLIETQKQEIAALKKRVEELEAGARKNDIVTEEKKSRNREKEAKCIIS